MKKEEISKMLEENKCLKQQLSDLQNQQSEFNNSQSVVDLLRMINEYSMELMNVPSDDLFIFALNKLSTFINAKSVHYTIYDADTKDLVVKHTSLSVSEQKTLKAFLGRDIIGMRFPLSDYYHDLALQNRIRIVNSIHEMSMGKISKNVGKLIEKAFNVGWFLGIAMTHNNDVFGTFVIIGKKAVPIPDINVLYAFAGVTANALVRKQAEQLLLDSQQRMKAYLDFSPDGIFITNYKGIILDVNPAGAALTGQKQEKLLGVNVADYFPKNIMSEIDKWVDSLVENGQSFKETIVYYRKDGTQSTALLSTVRISDDLYASFVKNIDDIVDAKNLLLIAKEKAEESDRLKSAFLANISHEIRSPMNGILGFANLLKTKNLNPEKQNKFLDLITSNGHQLLLLIEDLLDISRLDAKELKIQIRPCNLAKIIDEVFIQYNTKACDKGIKLLVETNSPESHFNMMSDDLRIKQIVTNLVNNAIKFTDYGSVSIIYSVKNNFFEIEVRDTGIGIPNDALKSIFNRFNQVDNANVRNLSGVGLGLTITKGLIELLSGTISVSSQLNKGSSFVINLPKTINNSKKI